MLDVINGILQRDVIRQNFLSLETTNERSYVIRVGHIKKSSLDNVNGLMC